MSLELPGLLYKDIGSQPRAGGTFSFILVSTEEELADGITEGWHETLLQAIDYAKGTETIGEIDDISPPTMAELETKAKELGIKYPSSIAAKTLQKKIDDALAQAATQG